MSPGSAHHGGALSEVGLFQGRDLCPARVRGCNRPVRPATGRDGAHHAAPCRRASIFRIDARFGVHGAFHFLMLGLRCWVCGVGVAATKMPPSRLSWAGMAIEKRLSDLVVVGRFARGAARPTHTSSRPRDGMTCAGHGDSSVWPVWSDRLEPLPGQRPAVHPVPAGQALPCVYQVGTHQATGGQHQQTPGPGRRPHSAGVRDRNRRCGRTARRSGRGQWCWSSRPTGSASGLE